MLSAMPVVDGPYASVVSLVNLPNNFDSVDETVLKENLTPENDAKDLCQYELTGMVGSKYLIELLIRYYTSGVNWDQQKDFIFRGVLKPMKGVNFD